MDSLTKKGLRYRVAALLALVIILSLLGTSTVPPGITISGEGLLSFTTTVVFDASPAHAYIIDQPFGPEMSNPPASPAYPQVAATNGGTTSGTFHTVNLPAGIEPGDLLLLFFVTDGNPTPGFPAGWVYIFQAAKSSAVELTAYYRIADGSEGATITVTTSASRRSAHTTYRITDYLGAPQAGAAATGWSDNPDPPNLAPTWGGGETLWFVVEGNDDDKGVETYPAGYGNGINYIAPTSTGCGLGTARRELIASSQNPGTFTIDGNDDWVANTLAIQAMPVTPSSYDFANVAAGQTYETGLDTFTISNTRASGYANITIKMSDIFVYSVAPSLVNEQSTEKHSIRTPAQTHSFYAAGLYWVLWVSNNHAYYSTSSDATTWTALGEDLGTVGIGAMIDWTYDGTYVHIVRTNSILPATGEDIYYRRGIPEGNATITWSAAWQLAVSVSIEVQASDPNIAIDSNGYIVIAYMLGTGGINYLPQARKNGETDGTWTTEWTKALGSPYATQDVVSLEDGQLYATWGSYNEVNTPLYGRLYKREATGTDNSGEDNKTGNMTDTTKNFTDEGVTAGAYIYNVTDGRSWGTITSVTTTTNPNDTLIFSGNITGGSEDDFDDGDSYEVFDWQPREDASASDLTGAFAGWCSRAVGNDVDIVFLSSDGLDPTENGNITHRHRTWGEGWGNETVLDTGCHQGNSPLLTVHGDAGDIAAFWSKSDIIYYKRYRDVTKSWDANPIEWLDETADGLNELNTGDAHPHYNTFEETLLNRMTIVYMTKETAAYKTKYALISFQRWFLSNTATPDSEVFGLKAGNETYNITVEDSYVTLVDNLLASDSWDFGLQLLSPTWFETVEDMSGIATIKLTYDDLSTSVVPVTLFVDAVEPEITQTPSTWSINSGSPIAKSETYSTGITWGNLTNTGTASIDVAISVGNMTNGNQWTPSDTATPGDKIFGLKAGLDDDDDLYDIVVKGSEPYNNLVSDMEGDTWQLWGIEFKAPTDWDDGVPKSGNVTLSAVLAS